MLLQMLSGNRWCVHMYTTPRRCLETIWLSTTTRLCQMHQRRYLDAKDAAVAAAKTRNRVAVSRVENKIEAIFFCIMQVFMQK